jgi:hypothetical protein
MSCE